MGLWKTLRWPLAATVLAAMALSGCGAAADKTGGLPKTSEKSLLALVARARTDVSRHNSDAAHAVLAAFVSRVSRLRTAGELNAATAGGLDRQARVTAAEITRARRTWAADQAKATQHAPALEGTDSRTTTPPEKSPGNDHPRPDHGPHGPHGPKDKHHGGGGPGDGLPTGGGPGDGLPTGGGPGDQHAGGGGND